MKLLDILPGQPRGASGRLQACYSPDPALSASYPLRTRRRGLAGFNHSSGCSPGSRAGGLLHHGAWSVGEAGTGRPPAPRSTRCLAERTWEMGPKAPSHVVCLYLPLIEIECSVEFRGLAKV